MMRIQHHPQPLFPGTSFPLNRLCVPKPEVMEPPANRLIDGWQIALPQTCVGDTVRVWIPAAAAYGHKGTGVPTGDLLFDIELLGVNRGAHSTE